MFQLKDGSLISADCLILDTPANIKAWTAAHKYGRETDKIDAERSTKQTKLDEAILHPKLP